MAIAEENLVTCLRQTTVSNLRFLDIENEQIKLILMVNTNFGVEIMNSKNKLRESLVTWYKLTFVVSCKRDLSLSNTGINIRL